jgi:DNA-binding transcriptional regulator LsrR (DeoR family)
MNLKSALLSDKDLIRHNLLVRIARLYYICSMTHQEIADQEGLSRIKVTRLLKEAVEKKIIEFNIQDPIINTLELEEEFRKTFNLKKVIITPTPQDPAEVYEILGRFAADFVMRNLSDGMNIGLDWGRTLFGMIPYLSKSACKDIKIITLTGGLAANPNQPNPYDVASSIANKIGGTPYYPIFPVIVENEEVKTVFLKEKHYKEIVELWGKIDVALVSVGIITPETGLYYSQAYPQKEVVTVREAGAIGDILARPFDKNGNLIKTSFTDRIITIDFDNLKKIPLVLGIAGGQKKVNALYAALKSGYLNALITDEECAQSLLKIHKPPV